MAYTENMVAAMVAFLVVNLVVVLLRCYVRLWLVKAYGIDDVFLLLAYLGFIAACVMGFISIHYGFTQETYQPWFNETLMVKYYWANQLALYISSGLVKLAVALVLYRLACNLRNQAILVVSIIVVVIWTIVTTIFSSGICAETTGATDYASGLTCTDVGYFRMISNIIIDFFFALYPVPMLWNSTLSRRMKYIVCGLLSLGIIASTATIVKLLLLVQLEYAQPSQLEYIHYQLLVWADVELGLSIFASAAAALRPLLRIVTGHDSSSTRLNSNGLHPSATVGTDLRNCQLPSPQRAMVSNAQKNPDTPASIRMLPSAPTMAAMNKTGPPRTPVKTEEDSLLHDEYELQSFPSLEQEPTLIHHDLNDEDRSEGRDAHTGEQHANRASVLMSDGETTAVPSVAAESPAK